MREGPWTREGRGEGESAGRVMNENTLFVNRALADWSSQFGQFRQILVGVYSTTATAWAFSNSAQRRAIERTIRSSELARASLTE